MEQRQKTMNVEYYDEKTAESNSGGHHALEEKRKRRQKV